MELQEYTVNPASFGAGHQGIPTCREGCRGSLAASRLPGDQERDDSYKLLLFAAF